MKKIHSLVVLGLVAFVVLSGATIAAPGQIEAKTLYDCNQKESLPLCGLADTNDGLVDTLSHVKIPTLVDPSWIETRRPITSTVTYSVSSRGTIAISLDGFAQQAQETFDHPKGWGRLGVQFKRVASGGDFTLYLAAANQMTSFSALGCDSTYSCQVGRDVIINQDRWLNATPAWNAGGGSLRDYRHMVVNHETGHWLGHGHPYCSAPGQPAPVMQQQSIDLQGCAFNPWPLNNELHSSRLGISL